MTFTRSAAALGAAVVLAGAAAARLRLEQQLVHRPSSAPAKLVVWRMGASVPSQVTWMNGVVAQFHKQFPQYKNTKVVVDWIPWGNRITDWTNALTSGKGGPDITELGNTDTPGIAAQGALANITSDVQGLVERLRHHRRQPGQRHGQRADTTRCRGSAACAASGTARTSSPRPASPRRPPPGRELVSDAKLLMKKYPGTYGLGAPSNYTNAIVSFIWGAGGQVAVAERRQVDGRAEHAAVRGRHQVLRRPATDRARLAVQVHRRDRARRARRHLRRLATRTSPWASSTCTSTARGPSPQLTAVSKKYESQWASFPIPSENGPNPAPAFAGGSDLGVWAKSKYKTGRLGPGLGDGQPVQRDHVRQLAGLLPRVHLAAVQGGVVHEQPGHVRLRQGGRLHPDLAAELARTGRTADATDAIIPTMMKSLMQGANFSATVNKANTELQNVLNTGSET